MQTEASHAAIAYLNQVCEADMLIWQLTYMYHNLAAAHESC